MRKKIKKLHAWHEMHEGKILLVCVDLAIATGILCVAKSTCIRNIPMQVIEVLGAVTVIMILLFMLFNISMHIYEVKYKN